jgi:tetratricopeptide (TPR) repeat protein
MTAAPPPSVDELIAEAIASLHESDNQRARLFASRARAIAPNSPRAENAMGLVETADQNHEAARRHYAAAVALAPDEAEYLVNLAYAQITAGAFDEARAHLEAALHLDPGNASAYQNLAWITKAAPGEPLIDRMRTLVARVPEGGADYVKLAYALGKCLDDVGDYDGAFAWYTRANDSQPSHYDPARHQQFFARIKETLTADFIDARRVEGFDSAKSIFIVGMPRSGSTLLEEKLCGYAGVIGLGEIGDIIRLSNAMAAAHPKRAPYPDWCLDAPKSSIGGLGKIYEQKYGKLHPGAERLVNKALLNFAYVGMIAAMLPRALIVETRRNPIDTCLSCYFKDLKSIHHYSVRLDSLGHIYRLYTDVMAHWKSALPGLVTLQYEQFIEDAESGAAALLAASGLSPAGAATAASTRHVQTFSAWQVKQPVYRHAVERWRNYEKHLGPLIDALGELAAT